MQASDYRRPDGEREKEGFAFSIGRRLHDSVGIQFKFLVGTGLILLLNCLLIVLIVYQQEKGQLEDRAFAQSELVMAAVEASRAYVREELRPAMYLHLGNEQFVPEAMSTSYVGRAVMERFAPAMAEEYQYRRVALQARNPSYEANELERRMIDYFNQHPAESEWRGLVKVDGVEKFKRFRPVVFEAECLYCHGSPADAPEGLVAFYGDTLGFNRKPGELAGVVAVGVPVASALADAKEKAFAVFWLVFMGMALVFILLSLFFHRMVLISLRGVLDIFREQEENGFAVPPLVPAPPAAKGAMVKGEDGYTGYSLGIIRGLVGKDELVELTAAACNMAEDLRRTREQLRQYNRELERRVAERTRALRESEARLLQQELEKKIQQTEKMVAMGQLVAGLAHEINNPLGIIICYVDLVKRQPNLSPRALQDLEVIGKQARGCKRIVGDLLDFARSGESRKQPADLNRIIEEVAGIVAPQFGKQGVAINLELAPGLPWLELDENKIKQVFLNLLLNARQAMQDEGGEIEIKSLLLAPSGPVRIEVRDNGPGIESEDLSKIFDPFFSTKRTGEGTGLGLSVSYGIVKEHGGEIRVASRIGQWTCFTIDLPVSDHGAPHLATISPA
ncbi:c-type heme family protein [Desulfurivibrio alkaliphilus]|uniref:histidine kinase n=1 Tax=Desulfurivibrio alkaliphilus (strain DSM 19089 / UNIQEM U267 / AHT2) TaxID=589865 RepID=D6Z6M3_DESAT|nr:DUF3365 domain-containing protein [Desulfurivibrio alkaliphilus]ADH84982.1 integral membrane sensor signal transduction histidine kinase [Desulfurivibrio alkaliphilus AHT 2]